MGGGGRQELSQSDQPVDRDFESQPAASPNDDSDYRGRDSPSLCELGLPPARIPACASTHWALASGMTVEPRVGPGMHDAGGWEPSDR